MSNTVVMITTILYDYFHTDVIGQVVDLDGIQTVQARGKDEQRVQFRLRDARLIIIIIYSC